MKLKEATIGKSYIVQDIKLCEPCGMSEGSCVIISLMEKGLIPGARLEVIDKKLGMYYLNIDGTKLIIRQPEVERFNIEVHE